MIPMNDSISTALILIPALPLAAAILIAILGPKLLREYSHVPLIIALIGSFLASLFLLSQVLDDQQIKSPAGFEHVVNLWTWANVDNAIVLPRSPLGESPYSLTDEGPRNFRIDVALRADALTSMMLCMVTFISTLVAVYASGYMHGDRGYWRFFSYIGLFVFSMAMLVSVSNFVLLFVFWEAVGACSYLLIGFWYEKPEAAAAGKKAFLVNRVGDFGFAFGLFLLWTTYGSLNFHDTLSDGSVDSEKVAAAYEQALENRLVTSPSDQPPTAPSKDTSPAEAETAEPTLIRGVLGQSRIRANDYRTGGIALAICLLLLVGACGKSAQFPLHVWLPDAMEGPTPVSALIHAATMVTAGVYMVTRCSPLFFASPEAQLVVACIGGFTALFAGLIALTQWDLKRVMAYSTLSQLGYMFLALGVGTFVGVTAGMFHLFTHAFFKALLFLGAGSVMHAMHHVIDMREFSGLRKVLPWTHRTFLVGCLALAGVFPLAGFWSKDGILGAVHDKIHAFEHEIEHRREHDEHGGEHRQAATLGQETFVVARLAETTAHSPFADWNDATLQRYWWTYTLLYYSGIFTAFLTAFYTFRAYCLTFWGELKIPAAAHHAHESPPVMIAPLMVLALCAIVVGAAFLDPMNLGHSYFADFLTHAPSLASPVVEATRPLHPEFHLSVAGVSTIVALAGIGLALFMYLGERTEARWVQRVSDLEGANQWTGFQWIGRLPQIGWIGWTTGLLRRSGLGFLSTLVGLFLGLVWLIIAIPVLLVQYFTPYRLSQNKFYIDELYNAFIVWPLRILAAVLAWLDRWVLDGLVNLVGYVPRVAGGLMREMHSGLVQFYALVMVIGVVILIVAQVFAR